MAQNMPAAEVTTLEIEFADVADPERDDDWAFSIRRDALEAGAVSVESVHTPAPDGSRAVDGLLASLIVAAAPGAVRLVVDAIRTLVQRSSGDRRVTVRIDGDELVLDGATNADQALLVAVFLARHTPDGDGASS